MRNILTITGGRGQHQPTRETVKIPRTRIDNTSGRYDPS